MNRSRTQAQAEAIGAGLALLPEGIRRRVEWVDVFEGDPVFGGVHDHEQSHGVSLRTAAHVCFGWPWGHLNRTTIVLPGVHHPEVIVHEFGHVLHETLGFWEVPRVAVSEYAETDEDECFAEAFTGWVLAQHEIRQPEWCDTPADHRRWVETLRRYSPETLVLFETLAG